MWIFSRLYFLGNILRGHILPTQLVCHQIPSATGTHLFIILFFLALNTTMNNRIPGFATLADTYFSFCKSHNIKERVVPNINIVMLFMYWIEPDSGYELIRIKDMIKSCIEHINFFLIISNMLSNFLMLIYNSTELLDLYFWFCKARNITKWGNWWLLFWVLTRNVLNIFLNWITGVGTPDGLCASDGRWPLNALEKELSLKMIDHTKCDLE